MNVRLAIYPAPHLHFVIIHGAKEVWVLALRAQAYSVVLCIFLSVHLQHTEVMTSS